MPRQPRYAKRYVALATDAVLAGKTAHKALALALGITPTTLATWQQQQPDFASAIADARAEYKRRKAEAKVHTGRPPEYASSMDELARMHAATGKYDQGIAKELGVSVTSVRNWRAKYPSFAAAIKEGRDSWDYTDVEESVVKRALGYEVKETTVTTGGKYGKTKTVTTRHIPPDTRAAQFVLTNRAPDRWKNRQEVEHTGAVGLTMPDEISDLFISIMGPDAAKQAGGEA